MHARRAKPRGGALLQAFQLRGMVFLNCFACHSYFQPSNVCVCVCVYIAVQRIWEGGRHIFILPASARAITRLAKLRAKQMAAWRVSLRHEDSFLNAKRRMGVNRMGDDRSLRWDGTSLEISELNIFRMYVRTARIFVEQALLLIFRMFYEENLQYVNTSIITQQDSIHSSHFSQLSD